MAFRTNKVPAIEERTVSGSSVSFNSAFALPLKACKVSFSATQAGSGDPSPSNPRAISGVSVIGLTANSTPVSVSLGDTYYGGYVDVVNKKLIVDSKIFDMGNLSWQSLSTTFYSSIANIKPATDYALCTVAKLNNNTTFDNLQVGEFGTRYGAGVSVWFPKGTYSTPEEFKTANMGNKIVVRMNNTVEIDLSSIPDLSSIIGNNTFSTDTGTLEITFSDLQEKSASGSVVSFNTALAMPLASCNIAVNAWQEGSGDPSPVNKRTIHGFREVNGTRCGVNTWSEDWENGDIDNTTGATTPSGIYIRSKDYEIIKPSTQYCVSLSQVSVFYYDASKAFISRVLTSYNNQVITTPSNARFFKIKRYGTSYGNDISLNYPSTQTGYIAYTGNIYTIQLGQDVYGAEVDAVNGVAHVTHGVSDMGDLAWSYQSSQARFYTMALANVMALEGGYGNWRIPPVCEIYKEAFNTTANNSIALYNTGLLYCVDNSITTSADFNTYVAGKKICYKLAEPFDIQLTPMQIETLIGNNTIFADTGDIDLTYKDLDIAKRGNFREVFRLPS